MWRSKAGRPANFWHWRISLAVAKVGSGHRALITGTTYVAIGPRPVNHTVYKLIGNDYYSKHTFAYLQSLIIMHLCEQKCLAEHFLRQLLHSLSLWAAVAPQVALLLFLPALPVFMSNILGRTAQLSQCWLSSQCEWEWVHGGHI